MLHLYHLKARFRLEFLRNQEWMPAAMVGKYIGVSEAQAVAQMIHSSHRHKYKYSLNVSNL
jgi:hypothetical protein